MKFLPLSRYSLLFIAAGAFMGVADAQSQAPATSAKTTPPIADSREHRGPPQESIDACKSLKSGVACSFTSPRGTESGTCWQPDSEHPLGCRPNRKSPQA